MFISHNSDFISHNFEFISCNSDFISHNFEFISCNTDFISCNFYQSISQVLHSSLTHIDSKNGNYVRLLFIDYSSAFNTIVPTKLAVKLSDLGLNTSLCDWIQDFLTGRPQVVKMGQFTSNSITLNVGAPQGCVLSPLLYSLYTHDCVSSHSSTSIVKFADDTVALGLISNNDVR